MKTAAQAMDERMGTDHEHPQRCPQCLTDCLAPKAEPTYPDLLAEPCPACGQYLQWYPGDGDTIKPWIVGRAPSTYSEWRYRNQSHWGEIDPQDAWDAGWDAAMRAKCQHTFHKPPSINEVR